MRFSKSVAALAIVFAVTVLGGHSAYADEVPQVVVARDPSQSQVATNPSANPQPVDVTVKSGDTLSSIASSHQTTVEQIISLNGIVNPDVINVGSVLHVPQSTEAQADATDAGYDQLRAAASAFITPPAPVYASAASTAYSGPASSSRTTSARASYGGSAGNSYVWGNCTWYVKERKPNLPNQLGNGGYGWLSTAAAAGYATGSSPAAGAIGVQSGHVVIVESVNGNGTVSISEMNYAGGLGVVHYRTVPASTFIYIYA